MSLFSDVHHIAELKDVLKKNNEILSSLAIILVRLEGSISKLNDNIKKLDKQAIQK